MKKTIVIILMAVMLATSATMVSARGLTLSETSDRSIIMDAFIIRPISVGAAVIGTGIFIFTLPFALITNSVDLTSEKLVVDPVKYAIKRPVGEI